MDDRYERAGTIGFRCAADLLAAESADNCSATAAKPCGTFDAPAAYTTLTGAGVKDWATYGRQSRMVKGNTPINIHVIRTHHITVLGLLMTCLSWDR